MLNILLDSINTVTTFVQNTDGKGLAFLVFIITVFVWTFLVNKELS